MIFEGRGKTHQSQMYCNSFTAIFQSQKIPSNHCVIIKIHYESLKTRFIFMGPFEKQLFIYTVMIIERTNKNTSEARVVK